MKSIKMVKSYVEQVVDKMTRSMELWNSINSMKDQGLTTEEPFLAILVFLNSINSMKSYFCIGRLFSFH
jgi:hypothetical protein